MEQVKRDQMDTLKNAITAMMGEQAFLKEIAAAADTEEIRALLAKKGIEATEEQIEEIINEGHAFGEKAIDENGELDMEALEQIAGGGIGAGLILGGIFLVGGILTGAGWKRTAIAAGAAFAIGCMAPCP